MRKIITILFILLLTGYLQAALITTAGDGNWASNLTWTGGVLPGATDDVQVDNNDSLWVISTDSYTVSEIWMGNNSILSIEGDLTIDSLHINNNATLYVSGTLTINGGISISNNADLTVNQTGTLDVNGDITASNNTSLTINGDANVTGDVTFTGNGSLTVGDTGTLDITGNLDTGTATVDGTGPITVSGTVTGTNSDDSQINSTLPIELISYNAVYQSEGFVLISWITASEINNDYFTLQRSDDGIHFTDIGFIDGAGNSNNIKKYEFEDNNPINGTSYYRIMQTDFDGNFEIFKAKVVSTSSSVLNDNSIKLYPNPAISTSAVWIESEAFEANANVKLVIVTLQGKQISSKTITPDFNGMINENINDENLPEGIYLIKLFDNYKWVSKKLIIN
ncbi:MAG: T9SS type A sorting domain-containing protein [Chlorobi bacterium]|nr:T9SS type A sorting domain-containing protein [Chlorobiota bacterium]